MLGYMYTDTYVKPCCWGKYVQIQMLSLLLWYICIQRQKISPAVRVHLDRYTRETLLLGYICVLIQKLSPAVRVHLYRYKCYPCCWGTPVY